MRADAPMVHVKASLTCQQSEDTIVYSRSYCGMNTQEVLAASDWERQVQHGSHSGRGQTFEAVKHIPFPIGNLL